MAQMTKQEFDRLIAGIKKRGGKVTHEFEGAVTTGIQLYWGETNHNIQVINDLVDCAHVMKGMRVKGLVEYLAQVIPHENLGKSGNFHFGKMDHGKKAAMVNTYQAFLIDNPIWHAYTDEKDPKPFDLPTFITNVKRRLSKAHKDGQLDGAGLKEFVEAIDGYKFEEEKVS